MHTSSYEETVYETPSRVGDFASTPEGRKEAKYYIYNLFEGLLVKRYMHMFFDDRNHNIYHVFGPYYGDDVILMLGRYPITFDKDNTVINKVYYEGTPGLYELIFMKQPDKYTEEELHTYSDVVKITEAHIQSSTGRVESSKSVKYNKFITPIFLSALPTTEQYWWVNMGGHGLTNLSNFKPNYIYLDNVDELCWRLQLLIASENADTGHGNEISSIIEELHEAGIINENADMFK